MKEYGVAPPETLAVALPSLPPKQEIFVDVGMVTVGPPELLTVADVVAVHPLASVTVML